MPKIEVNEQEFYTLAGKPGGWKTKDEFEENLTCAKAELDEDSDKSLPASERTLKIELNDTNRPDLWGTAGCARQLRIYNGGKTPTYDFFSQDGDIKNAKYKVKVDKSVKQVRPFIAGFVASGKTITDPLLRDIIQTQEKLAWNYGRKRRSISMGVYRTSLIKWPIIYKGVDPNAVSFEPLQWEGKLSLTEILRQHPKGKEYAFILEKEPVHPLLTDSEGVVLSYPPIINSSDLGAVQVGDDNIFIELTGTDMPSLTLAASIVACDLADNGFSIDPVEFEYDYDLTTCFPTSSSISDKASSQAGTPFGKKLITPYYFQEPVFCSLSRIERFLGDKLTADECVKALARMGVKAEAATDAEKGVDALTGKPYTKAEGVRAWPPEYRNDFLHAVDVAEDVMIGRGLNSFKPQRPADSTIGRLLPITLFSRQVKEQLIGLGYQEMIYNYLDSHEDLVENMNGDGNKIIRIFNPMTENYEYVRDSIIASLMSSESISGRSAYPHKIFEVGKIARLDDTENYKTTTRQFAGFLHAGAEASFNTAAAELQTLFYYLCREYNVEESTDPRFIPGRAAALVHNGKQIGVFGELHPQVLENWGVTVPVTAGEIDLDALIA